MWKPVFDSATSLEAHWLEIERLVGGGTEEGTRTALVTFGRVLCKRVLARLPTGVQEELGAPSGRRQRRCQTSS